MGTSLVDDIKALSKPPGASGVTPGLRRDPGIPKTSDQLDEFDAEIVKSLSAGPIESFLVGAGAGITNIDQEGQKVISGFFESKGLVPEGSTKQISDEMNERRAEFNAQKVNLSGTAGTGEFVGEIAPMMVIPGGASGKVLTKMLTGAAGAGVTGFLQPTTEAEVLNEERIANTLTSTLFGGLVPGGVALGKETGKLGKNIAQSFTRSGGKKSVVKGAAEAQGSEIISEASKRAKRLGVWLSPGESTGFDDLVAKEKGVFLTDSAMNRLGITMRVRNKSLTKSINDLVEEIAPHSPERAKLISEGYDALAESRFSPKILKSIEEDPVLKREWGIFLRDRDFRPLLDTVPEDSMVRLDKFQKFLGGRQQLLVDRGKGEVADVVKNKRTLIRDFLDVTVPEYGVARREAQLNIVKRSMLDGLNKIKGAGKIDGEVVPTPVQFFQKFLKSSTDFEDLVRNLGDDSPAALQKATDLRAVLGAIEKSPLNGIFKTKEMLATVRTGGQGAPGIVLFETISTLRSRFYEGLIDTITDPALADDVFAEAAKMAKSGEKRAAGNAADLLATAVARSLGKLSTRDPEGGLPDGAATAPIEEQTNLSKDIQRLRSVK